MRDVEKRVLKEGEDRENNGEEVRGGKKRVLKERREREQ